KTILAGLINGAAVVVFIQQGVVYWKFAIPMVIAASIGGWLGAAGARTLDKRLVRRLVITIGLVLTVWYFSQTMF
ncbi:MAG: TSUP family transporter, partial [Phycisphaerae bacterium]